MKYWRSGKKEIVKGKTIEDGLSKAGYGLGAVSALDFYEPLPESLKNPYDQSNVTEKIG